MSNCQSGINQENVGLQLDSGGGFVAASTDQAEVFSATFDSVFPNKISWALCIASGLMEEESDEHWVQTGGKKKKKVHRRSKEKFSPRGDCQAVVLAKSAKRKVKKVMGHSEGVCTNSKMRNFGMGKGDLI